VDDERDDNKIRIDKWLWAARFFKTRSLAVDALVGGKVKIDGTRVKPSKGIEVGDRLSVHIGPYEYRIRVLKLSDRRGPAAQAALLYEERAESKEARAKLATQLADTRVVYPRGEGRPTKRARRELIKFKKGDDQH
jgi:ribosome-associated heat shock protein Hsp15